MPFLLLIHEQTAEFIFINTFLLGNGIWVCDTPILTFKTNKSAKRCQNSLDAADFPAEKTAPLQFAVPTANQLQCTI